MKKESLSIKVPILRVRRILYPSTIIKTLSLERSIDSLISRTKAETIRRKLIRLRLEIRVR